MGRKELEDQLRELRKAEGAKPISKMKAVDISAEIERMKNRVETVPASRQNPERPTPRKDSAVETIQEAKQSEFPTKPSKQATSEVKNVIRKRGTPATPKATGMSKAQLMKMLSEVSDDE
jgi:hypothetical protein